MAEEKVLVAMSGGVDSTVTAALLLERGYRVVGGTLLFEPAMIPEGFAWGCGGRSEGHAREAAEQLGIELVAVDAAKEFEREVLRPSWEQYALGRTPNPCVRCNVEMKLGVLARRADEMGIRLIATGHYARVRQAGGPVLMRGRDRGKDQSYFLFALREDQLERVIFPLGELTKEEVRERARRLGLSAAARPDSQDACFSGGELGFPEALRVFFGERARPGKVIGPDEEELGEHQGIHRYTIGQRKGIGIATGERSYVVDLRADDASIRLSHRKEDTEGSELTAGDVRWTRHEVPTGPLECEVQIRYRHRAASAEVTSLERGRARVVFAKPQRAITPGQAVVFYKGEEVLGGGWIERRES